MLPKGINVKNSFEQWIGIAPFAAHEGKVYPPHLMHQVIEQLIAKYPKARFFLFGRGQQEDEYFTEWIQNSIRRVSLLQTIGIATPRAHPDESSEPHDFDGFVEYASGLADGYSRHKHMGSHSSLCRILRMGTDGGQHHPDRPGVPSV